MIQIQRFVCNMLAENCYVVSDESGESVIIDCGAYYPEEQQAISDYITTNGLRPVHLLCTHGHLDHCFGNAFIYHTYNLKPELAAGDEFLVTDLAKQAEDIFGTRLPIESPPVGHYFTDGERITFGNHQLQVIPTPGHTPGGVVYYCADEKVAFTGDTLFQMSVGRTDFEGGSMTQLLQSLATLSNLLPDDVTLLSGHGQQTTLAHEKRYNPYLR